MPFQLHNIWADSTKIKIKKGFKMSKKIETISELNMKEVQKLIRANVKTKSSAEKEMLQAKINMATIDALLSYGL